MRRLGLIAGREVAAYAGVPSFWVALLMGPLLMLLTGLAARSVVPSAPQPAPRYLSIEAADPALQAAALAALRDAGEREGRPAIFPASATSASTDLRVDTGSDGAVNVQLRGELLPESTVALLREALGDVARRDRLRKAGATPEMIAAAESPPVRVQEPAPAPAPQFDTGRVGRFAVMMLLWMTLIGALGMLLQAIVRERANRALESLLASARGSEVIFGKLAGVGALSVLVLGVWLAAGAAIAASPLGGVGNGLPSLLLGAFSNPVTLIHAGVMYVLAFAMYGSALIGLGAIAKDVPSAQNLSRPVFGVLLLVFFVALAKFAGSGDGLDWLGWVPLFTPFVALMAPPGAIGMTQTVVGYAGMILATALFGWLATRAMVSEGLRPPRVWVERSADRRSTGRRAAA
jgi:ABC-2 type transport system permease protein